MVLKTPLIYNDKEIKAIVLEYDDSGVDSNDFDIDYDYDGASISHNSYEPDAIIEGDVYLITSNDEKIKLGDIVGRANDWEELEKILGCSEEELLSYLDDEPTEAINDELAAAVEAYLDDNVSDWADEQNAYDYDRDRSYHGWRWDLNH